MRVHTRRFVHTIEPTDYLGGVNVFVGPTFRFVIKNRGPADVLVVVYNESAPGDIPIMFQSRHRISAGKTEGFDVAEHWPDSGPLKRKTNWRLFASFNHTTGRKQDGVGTVVITSRYRTKKRALEAHV